MIELIFLLGFSLHNLEEALWLPQWSKFAEKYHHQVTENQFQFAVIVVTIFGYLVTFQYLVWKDFYPFSRYIYLGFLFMMVGNVIFPHLLATIMLKRYAPGFLTGFLLNGPIGFYLLYSSVQNFEDFLYIAISGIIVSGVVLFSLGPLFKIGEKLIDYSIESE